MTALPRCVLSPLLLLAACGPGPGIAPAAVAPAPAAVVTAPPVAPAAPAAGPACLPSDSEFGLSRFEADDRTATVCVRNDTEARCVAIDLATGNAAAATEPPRAARPAAAVAVKHDAAGTQLCRGAACVRLDLPTPGKDDGEHDVEVSADGKVALATGGGLNKLVLLDAATGKRRREIAVSEGDYQCLQHATFLGDTIYVLTSVCAGPGGNAALYRSDGTRIPLKISINPFGSIPIKLEGSRYVILDWATNDYVVIDAATGSQVRAVEAPCDDCDGRGLPNTSDLAITPTGKVVTVGPLLVVSDPKTGKIEHTHQLAMCDE